MALGVGAAVANAVVVALGCVGAVGVGLALARWARAGYAAAGRRARRLDGGRRPRARLDATDASETHSGRECAERTAVPG